MQTPSLWQRLGGTGALEIVVDEFYRRVLADPLLAPFFEDTDMETLRAHQISFLSSALGGPEQYTGEDLRSAHEDLKLEAAHFVAVAGHLRRALEAVDVGVEEAADVMAIIAGLKGEIVRPKPRR